METCFSNTSPLKTAFKARPDGIPGLSSLALPDVSAKTSHCRNLLSPGPAAVLSPVTNLALDMNNLIGLGRYYYYLSYIFHLKNLHQINSHGQRSLLGILKFWLVLAIFMFFVFNPAANVIPQKEEIMQPLRRFPPLPLMSHLMPVCLLYWCVYIIKLYEEKLNLEISVNKYGQWKTRSSVSLALTCPRATCLNLVYYKYKTCFFSFNFYLCRLPVVSLSHLI